MQMRYCDSMPVECKVNPFNQVAYACEPLPSRGQIDYSSLYKSEAEKRVELLDTGKIDYLYKIGYKMAKEQLD